MSPTLMLMIFLALAAAAFVMARQRALASVDGRLANLHSKPIYHGLHAALLTFAPPAFVLLAWAVLSGSAIDHMILSGFSPAIAGDGDQQRLALNTIHRLHAGELVEVEDPMIADAAARFGRLSALAAQLAFLLGIGLAGVGMLKGLAIISPDFRARNVVERAFMILLIACSAIAILSTLGIILSLLFESLQFFGRVSATEFLFGLQWSPQTAIRADQVGSSGTFGAVPLFLGTLLISVIAMLVAVPIGLMSAIFMTQYASEGVRKVVKPALEILAGVPTVVYGFFAALTVAPALRGAGEAIGLDVASESALAAGLVMGIMIIPFMSSLSDDAISAVPSAMRDGSYALGATKSETIKQVLIPAALPGIMGAFLLSVSRAIGETMIVVMAAGMAANLTVNPLAAVTTVTVQIVALLTGDQEFDSAKTLSAFALGLVLFIATLILNMFALYFVRKYRETYE